MRSHCSSNASRTSLRRALAPPREIIPARPFELRTVLIVIVDDIDAAAKRVGVVDQRELTMRARPALRAEQQMRVIDAMFDAALLPQLEHRQIAFGADAIRDHAHLESAIGGANKRIGDGAADVVVGKDVRFQRHRLARIVDALGQRREELYAALEDAHAIAGGEAEARRSTAGEQRLAQPLETAPRTHTDHRLCAARRSGNCRIASLFDHEKHLSAASRKGSHRCEVCSRGASVTSRQCGTSRLN